MTPPPLRLWTHPEPRAALGLAVDYLSRKPAFALTPFGEMTRAVAHQVQRGHQAFVLAGAETVVGYLGWALTSRALAEQWLAGRGELAHGQCREGDCVILNAWAAESRDVVAFLTRACREMFRDKNALYFKRIYPGGRFRPMCLTVSTGARWRGSASALRPHPRDAAGYEDQESSVKK